MSRLFSEAVAFAAYAHETQKRRGSDVPFIVHPMEAAVIASTMTDDEEVLAAAVLHDVVEDCGVTPEELEDRFGVRVRKMVEIGSEKKEDDPEIGWNQRKLQTILHLEKAPRQIMILALSDKLSNLRQIDREKQIYGSAMWDQFSLKKGSQHKWYYASIAEVLKPLNDTAAYAEYGALVKKIFG